MSADLLRRAAEDLRDDAGTSFLNLNDRDRKFYLAVADWLEHSAVLWESDYRSMRHDFNPEGLADSRNRHALAVARAYLGDPS